MFVNHGISVFFIALTAASFVAPAAANAQFAGSGTRLVLPQREPALQQVILLDVIRRRMPVVVQTGRFTTEHGISQTCIHARRALRGAMPRSGGPRTLFVAPPPCRMVAAFVDGVPISGVGAFLAGTRSRNVQSVELLGAAEAMQRYGLASDGSEVLDIWTRGRGPYTRR